MRLSIKLQQNQENRKNESNSRYSDSSSFGRLDVLPLGGKQGGQKAVVESASEKNGGLTPNKLVYRS